jgi:hypothetical protein
MCGAGGCEQRGRWSSTALTVAVVVLALAALATPPAAAPAPGLFVGVADDTLKATPAETAAITRDLGLRAYSFSLRWSAGERTLSPSAAGSLDTATRAAGGARVVVYVYGDYPPSSAAWRDNYCAYTRDLVQRFPQVNDVVIWNEPNLTYFWSPQFDGAASIAPVQYAALLERCYDVLHAARPGIRVIAPATSPWGNDDPLAESNISHSPTAFLLQLGRAYRASGRTRPIFDVLGHHPHPVTSNERPWLRHSDPRFVTMGDLDRLVETVDEAFRGTAQPTPARGLPIWYLETGYQTTPDPAKRGLYSGIENWPGTLPAWAGGEPDSPAPDAASAAPDQATQLVDSLRLAYCQPHVQAYFLFQLRDEPMLGGWQSGVLWADGTRKGSYEPFRRTVAEVHAGAVDCARLKGGPVGVTGSSAAADTRGAGAAAQGGTRAVDRRAATRLRWLGRQPSPFGFARLAVRLTRDGRPLRGQQVTFGLAGSLLLTTTGADGVATIRAATPLSPCSHLVSASFRGSRELAPAGLKTLVRVVNSRATLATAGASRALTSVGASFRARFDGRRLAGFVRARAGGRLVVARRLSAFGVSPDGRSAWLAGRTTTGARLLARVQLGPRGKATLQLWVRGRPLPRLRGLDVALTRR